MNAIQPPTGLAKFDSKPTDVIITAYPKAGHTILQNMTHEILIHSGRKPDTAIDDISVAIPWLEFMPEFGLKHPDCTPRVYKAHSPRWKFEQAKHTEPKFIAVIRNPLSFPASWLNFLFDIFTDNTVTDPEVREAFFHIFVETRLLGKPLPAIEADGHMYAQKEHMAEGMGSWFAHTHSWVRPLRKNTLVLFYEDVISDLQTTVRTVADFMGCAITTASLEEIAINCERGAMLNDTRFRCGVEAKGLGLTAEAWKVKDLNTGGFKHLQIREEHKAEVAKQMKETFGVDSYEKLKKEVKREQQNCSRQ